MRPEAELREALDRLEWAMENIHLFSSATRDRIVRLADGIIWAAGVPTQSVDTTLAIIQHTRRELEERESQVWHQPAAS